LIPIREYILRIYTSRVKDVLHLTRRWTSFH